MSKHAATIRRTIIAGTVHLTRLGGEAVERARLAPQAPPLAPPARAPPPDCTTDPTAEAAGLRAKIGEDLVLSGLALRAHRGDHNSPELEHAQPS
jgi:hypothetical protein